jgi:hypothetical protein
MKNTILRAKRELEKYQTNIIFGKIKEGNSLISEQGVYYDFLRNADGLRAGAIDLWGYEDLFRNQYMVPDKEKWMCIGQIDYIPLMLKKESNEVYIYNEMLEGDKKWILISDFYKFIMNYVFGDKYCIIVPDCIEDRWYKFIKRYTE